MDFDNLIKEHHSIFIQGCSGTGKTSDILNFLKNNNYHYTYEVIQNIKADKSIQELMTNRNIIKLFDKKAQEKKRVVVIDNIDYIQTNEKKTITYFSKMLKRKDFHKVYQNVCIVFIGIKRNDKKVNELKENVSCFVDWDIRGTTNRDNAKHLNNEASEIIMDKTMRGIVLDLLLERYHKQDNLQSEKTTISLCFHENIPRFIYQDTKFYELFLENTCAGDYYDRISFQKQLWQFNEMTYILKVLQNYDLYRYKNETNINKNNLILQKSKKEQDIIFTKVLTKYSNEFSNYNFITSICNRLNIQRLELITLIQNVNGESVQKNECIDDSNNNNNNNNINIPMIDTNLNKLTSVELNRCKKILLV